ncbi:predicted protein [Naegleria gruberi]|uniref:Predicted protein n=1 Tax=Naegleria gruberi TaxID=5762 RepID=D2VJ85_NAEGR|nr:uncharacterized protein NAEGRDRAFT_68946 [Naegleria gruberi]EFC43238.1 predicted protein [Naegleria gruberi]|eukprot:XP_002675982.1 predicted protein [Naegleria gruberi strain NEG-M]
MHRSSSSFSTTNATAATAALVSSSSSNQLLVDSNNDFTPFNSSSSNANMINNNTGTASYQQDDTISLADTSMSFSSDLLISSKPRVEERITSLIQTFKFSNSSTLHHQLGKSIIPHLLPLFTHGILLPLQLIALGFIPFVQWGQIAHDINLYFFKTLITFGFHFIPHVAVVVLSVIVFVIHWFLILHTYIEYKGYLVGFVKFKRRSKQLSRFLVIALFILNLPITHLFSSFWSCDYTEKINSSGSDGGTFYLRDYSQVECWGPMNAVFAALSVIHIWPQVLIVLLFLFGVIETDSLLYSTSGSGHGLLKRRASFFSSKSPVFISVVNLVMMLFYWYSQMIPNYSSFPYLFPSFSLFLFLILAVLIFIIVPFNVRSENSYMAGIMFGIVGQNIVSLTCSIVNIDTNTVDVLSTNGVIYWGAAIGGFLIFLTVGVTIMDIYTRRATKVVKKICSPLLDSGNTSEIALTPDLLEEIGEANLEMAIRFCSSEYNSRQRTIVDENNDNPPSTKCRIISAIIRGSIRHKSEYSSASICLAIVNYVRYHKLDQTQHHAKTNLNIALYLLKRMYMCKPSIFEKYVGSVRRSEIETQLMASLNISADSEKSISKTLQHLSKKQSKLREFHKSFWKVVITNNENSLNELIIINRKITKLTSHCKSKFESLVALHSYNKSALRPYAMFVEEFIFDKEKSKEILQLVAVIEEEESQKLKSKQPTILETFSERSLKKRRSRVVPAIIVSESMSQLEEEKKIKFDDICEFENQHDEEQFSKKQQDTYTKSIQRRSHLTTTIIFTSFFPWVSLLVVIGGLIAAVMISNSFTGSLSSGSNPELSAYQNLCATSPYPFLILCEIRLLQRHYYFDKDNSTFSRTYKKTQQEKLKTYKGYLKSFLEQMSETDKTGYLDLWEGQETEIFMPVISTTFNENSTMNYEKRNVTIKEIVELMDVHVDRVKDFTETQVKQTLDNPSFLFFWQNRKYNAYALENVCSDVLTAKSNKVSNILNLFLYVMGASIGVFFILGLITLVVLIDYFKKQQRIAHLFFGLAKEESGKIYHTLEKASTSKVSHNIDSDRTSLAIGTYFTPTRTLISLVIIIFLTALLAIILYLVDTNNNLKNQDMALNKLYQASKIKVIFNRIMFKLGELLLMNDWKPLWGGLSCEIDRIHKDITTHSREVETYMKSYLYGDSSKGYFSLLGVSDDIDKLILPANCSRFQNSGNITDLSSFLENNTITNNRQYFECLSVTQLLQLFIVYIDLYNQLAYRKTYIPQVLLPQFHSVSWEMAASFNYKVKTSLEIFITTFSKLSNLSLTISISVIFFVIFLICAYIGYSSIIRYEQEIYQLRQMFNHVSWEVLDNNQKVSRYILNDQLYSTLNMFRRSKQKKFLVDSRERVDNLTAILSTAIEGVIQFDAQGTVEMINTSALRMMGIKSSSEVIGTPVTSLFSTNEREKLEEKLSYLQQSESSGEVVELNAKRGHAISTNTLDASKSFPIVMSISVAQIEVQQNEVMMEKKQKKIFTAIFRDITSEKKSVELLNIEKKKSENLLLNILPVAVANRLKAGETTISEKFDDVTCLFSDMVGFTSRSSYCSPTELVQMLNYIVNGFDALCDIYKLEKIKTIGDAYFVAGGLYLDAKESDHPERTLNFAIDMFKVLKDYNESTGNLYSNQLNIRVGIHTGSVVAGVIGTKKFAFDLWGDAVNTASRMESTSLPGRIQISRSTYERVHDLYDYEPREVEVKGKGLMMTYLLKQKFNDFENRLLMSVGASIVGLVPDDSSTSLDTLRIKKPSTDNYLEQQ